MPLPAHVDRAIADEPSMSVEKRQALRPLELAEHPFSPLAHDIVLATNHRVEVHPDLRRVDPEAAARAGDVSRPRARDHRLRRRAAGIRAGTPGITSFDEQDAPSSACELRRERYPCLPAADDDRVRFHGLTSFPHRGMQIPTSLSSLSHRRGFDY